MLQIFYDNKVVGQAEIIREGLFYKIHCFCTLPDSGIYRIAVMDGETVLDLGICVPSGDKFVLNTRVPVKKINGDHVEFQLVAGNKQGIPVATGREFPHLDKLETARLQVANGQWEIMID